MKKFIEEFKVFITRGNVIDMAVGVTVGSAFTAIVTAVSTNIIKPFINWIISLIIGADTLSQCFTFLGAKPADLADPNLDLSLYNYIDWGAFINAIINFFVIAFVLFCVVKAINALNDKQKAVTAKLLEGVVSPQDKKEMKKLGISLKDKEAVDAYFKAKQAEADRIKAEEEEKERLEREANPTTEELLKQIRDLLQNK
ncbi:MAG: large conductance mechanosensitive channel protein MscL [Clostridia bacterium]|nr:large conductance mechanosensitive channel protein MscL [Clostridia bacterium]